MKLHAAVLAGGAGTRFWPASTRAVPKQFLPLTGRSPLLLETLDRLVDLVPPERTLVVTGRHLEADTARLLADRPAVTLLGEPEARNTAAACALAAHWARQQDDDAVLLVLPADHAVDPPDAFRDALHAAAERAATAGTLLTLGLRPTRPATGFGWIRLGDGTATSRDHAVHAVSAFKEKPDAATAQQYLAGGDHLWNLGNFAWRPDDFLSELAEHAPGVAGPLEGIGPSLGGELEAEAIATAYEQVEIISVDHAVLERSSRVECVPCGFGWDDLGSYSSLARALPPDADGNHAQGKLLSLDSSGCVVWAEEGRLTALLGVEDLVVVHANGVTLVAPRDRAEEVRRLVDSLGDRGFEEFA